MSMDLEFPKNLPQIRIHPIQIRPLNSDTIKFKINDAGDRKIRSDEIDHGCRTPTSEDHKIPKILTCPGAPKKPRRPAIPCKRKLTMDLQFFEIVNQEEVDAFFRSAYDFGATSAPAKKSCGRSA